MIGKREKGKIWKVVVLILLLMGIGILYRGQEIVLKDANIDGCIAGNGDADRNGGGACFRDPKSNSIRIERECNVGGSVFGGNSRLSLVESNRVNIDGGKIRGDVFGGRSYRGKAVNNVVIIEGGPKFGPSTVIYGGHSGTEGQDVLRGNRLEIGSRKVRVKEGEGVKNFKVCNFNNVGVNEPPVLRVEGKTREGDRVNVIESRGEVSQAERINLFRDGLVEYDYMRLENPQVLTMIIKGETATEQAQVINKAAGVVVVGQGKGFITEKGIEEAVRAAKGKEGIEVFGVVEGESSKYKKDTEVKIEGVKVVGGVAKRVNEGEVVIGGYVEHGKGDYKIEEEEGVGNVRYAGIGGLLKKGVGERGYIQGSVSLGGYGIEYENEMNGTEDIGYDYKVMYERIHIGSGYKVEASERINVEMGGKIMVTGQERKELRLRNGKPIKIQGVVMRKVKGELKMEWKCGEKILPYVGMGYEYGVLGEVKGKVEGVQIKELDLKGGEGIGEIGIEAMMGRVNINIKGRGYVGIREGIEGMLKVKYAI
jgi:hypothetical protein